MGPFHPRPGRPTRAPRPHPSPRTLRAVARLLPIGTLLAWQLAMAGPAQAKAGDLDPSFGIGGKVTTDFFGGLDEPSGLVALADGSLVAAGFANEGPPRDFALARYPPDGTLDPSFGSGGKVTTGISGFDDQAFALALQPDGKLVAAGEASADFALARYNPDGTLDPSFNGSGLVTTDFAGAFDRVEALAVQADGKLVAAGQAFSGASLDFALARYNPDGSLDASFGSGGKVTTDLAGGDDAGFFAMAVLAGGKLMVLGSGLTGAGQNFTLARYNPNGTLDPSFGSGGMVTTDFAGGDDIGLSLVVQANGKLVAGGYDFTGAVRDFALARYKPNGTLDHSFGRRGKVTTDFTDGGDDGATILAGQPGGKLVAAGFAGLPGGEDWALVRYRA